MSDLVVLAPCDYRAVKPTRELHVLDTDTYGGIRVTRRKKIDRALAHRATRCAVLHHGGGRTYILGATQAPTLATLSDADDKKVLVEAISSGLYECLEKAAIIIINVPTEDAIDTPEPFVLAQDDSDYIGMRAEWEGKMGTIIAYMPPMDDDEEGDGEVNDGEFSDAEVFYLLALDEGGHVKLTKDEAEDATAMNAKDDVEDDPDFVESHKTPARKKRRIMESIKEPITDTINVAEPSSISKTVTKEYEAAALEAAKQMLTFTGQTEDVDTHEDNLDDGSLSAAEVDDPELDTSDSDSSDGSGSSVCSEYYNDAVLAFDTEVADSVLSDGDVGNDLDSLDEVMVLEANAVDEQDEDGESHSQIAAHLAIRKAAAAVVAACNMHV